MYPLAIGFDQLNALVTEHADLGVAERQFDADGCLQQVLRGFGSELPGPSGAFEEPGRIARPLEGDPVVFDDDACEAGVGLRQSGVMVRDPGRDLERIWFVIDAVARCDDDVATDATNVVLWVEVLAEGVRSCPEGRAVFLAVSDEPLESLNPCL